MTMKISRHILALLAAAIMPMWELTAQVEQPIVVNEYNGKAKKTPLADVGVTVMNAGATKSDQNGAATLRFRTLHAGDRVTVRRIDKAGYEIFNQQAVDQWNVSPQRPFMLILCKSEDLKALRDQYNRVASQSYERQYKQEQARLAAERKKTSMLEEEYQKKLTELENQYQQQLEDLDNYVDQFARIDLSELSGKQMKLIKLVQDGKIDEAIERYESEDFQAQYRKQSEDIAKIDQAQAKLAKIEAEKRSQREKIHAAIGRQIATYRLAGGRENFQKVTDLLKGVADADTTNALAVWEYANHALRQHQYDESERYFNIYLRNKTLTQEMRAIGWRNLSQCYTLQRNFPASERASLDALHVYDSLVKINPQQHNRQYLATVGTLTNLYRWMGNMDATSQLLEKAMPMVDNLYKEDPETCADLATSLKGSLSIALCAKGDVSAAVATGKESVSIAKAIYEKDNDKSRYLTWALSNMGQVYYMSSNWEGLVEISLEQNALYEVLYKNNPEANIVLLQSGYNNTAEAYLHLPDLAKCEEYLVKSEELLDQIIQVNAAPHRYDQFNLYDIGAHLYQALDNAEKMNLYIDKAITAFGQMPEAEQKGCQQLYDALVKMKE